MNGAGSEAKRGGQKAKVVRELAWKDTFLRVLSL